MTLQMGKHITLGNLLQFLKSTLYYSEDTKESMEPLLFHTYVKVKKELNKKRQAQLLIPLMKQYYRMEPELEAKIKEYE